MATRRLAPAAVQPESFAFTAENLAWAKKQIARYPQDRQASAVISLLWRAQEQAGGWIPQKAIEHVAEILTMPFIRVLEVATFYTMFNLEPVGRHFVQLCGTTPCMLRGANDLKKVCHEKIGDERHVTADGKFSWIEVECLGACVNAPMVQINFDTYEDLTPERFGQILDELAAGQPVPTGPQIDRQFSAPVGGPTTLTDPSIYQKRTAGKPNEPALADADAKLPTEAANVREAAIPKPPAGDASGNSNPGRA